MRLFFSLFREHRPPAGPRLPGALQPRSHGRAAGQGPEVFAPIVSGIHLGASPNDHLGRLQLALQGCVMQRGVAHLILVIISSRHRGLGLKQEFSNFCITVGSGYMK